MRTPALALPLAPISPVDDLDGFLAWHRAQFGDTTMNTPAGGEGAPAGGEGAPPAAGGAPPAGGAAADAAEDQGDERVPPATPPAATEQPGKVEDLPAWAQKIITDTRVEAATHRTGKTAAEQQVQEIVKSFAKAAGIPLPGQDEAPDPAKLAEQLSSTQAQARDRAAELVVWRHAADLGVNAAAVTDSRAFEAAIKNLDPSDTSKFEESVKAAVKTAVDANPLLRAGQAPARGGSEFPGGPGGDSKPSSLQDAIAARMTAGG